MHTIEYTTERSIDMGLMTKHDYTLTKLIHRETYKGLTIAAFLCSHGGMLVEVFDVQANERLWHGDNILQARAWIDKTSLEGE